MRRVGRHGELAIEPPTFAKIETKVSGESGGFATIKQRTELVRAVLVMDYVYAGHTFAAGKTVVLLKGEAGLQPWAKHKYQLDGKDFCLCPESMVMGFEVDE